MAYARGCWRTWARLWLALFLGWPALAVYGEGGILVRDGVIVDRAQLTVFLMHPEGGLEAISWEDGQVRWHNPLAARPLASSADHVWAQAEPTRPEGDLDILVLDHRGIMVHRARVPIPPATWASVDDGLGRTFAIAATARSDGAGPLFHWRSHVRRVLGARAVLEGPPRSSASDPRMSSPPVPSIRVEEGSFRIDPGRATAAVLETVVGAAHPTQVTRVSFGGGADPTSSRDRRRSRNIDPVSDSGYLSADGRHVLISRRVADDRTWARYRWQLFDREQGELIGEHTSHVAWSPFLVIGSTLLLEASPWTRRDAGATASSPLRLLAIDLDLGRILWHRDLRDTSYPGPYPS